MVAWYQRRLKKKKALDPLILSYRQLGASMWALHLSSPLLSFRAQTSLYLTRFSILWSTDLETVHRQAAEMGYLSMLAASAPFSGESVFCSVPGEKQEGSGF